MDLLRLSTPLSSLYLELQSERNWQRLTLRVHTIPTVGEGSNGLE